MTFRTFIGKRNALIGSTFLAAWLLPKAVSMVTLSNTAPVALFFIAIGSTAVAVIANLNFASSKHLYLLGLLLFPLLFASSILSYLLFNDTKPLFSAVPLIISVFLGIVLGENYCHLTAQRARSLATSISISLLAIGWCSILFDTRFGNYALLAKPVFPFPEESHFALALGPILIGTLLAGLDRATKSAIILSSLALSAIFPNVTLLAFCILAIIVSALVSRGVTTKIFAIIATFLATTILIFTLSNDALNYFTVRLAFWESENLSALVYAQGWSDMWIALKETYGLGLGFQRMGSIECSELCMRIYALAGEYKNREDGSFLASKLISEFGVFGVAAIIYYIYSFFSFASNKTLMQNEKARIALGIYTGFLVELFVRSFGYFSPNIIILALSFFSLRKMHKKTGLENQKLCLGSNLT